MKQAQTTEAPKLCRREFMCACGCTAAGAALASKGLVGTVVAAEAANRTTGPATVRCAFLYPPTASLKKAGYYSWPGSGFDAEGHQKAYLPRIAAIAQKLGMQIPMDEKPLHDSAGVARFIGQVKQSKPDGLLLIPFYKGTWASVVRIVKETGIPTVTLATMGILLNPHINQLYRTPGVYLISSLDDFDAVEYGMKMIRTSRQMKESRIVSLAGSGGQETAVAHLGTRVRALPRKRFAEEFKRVQTTDEVRALARAYQHNAKKVVEPSEADVLDAAKTYVACKRILAAEKGDAIMMDCLGGIRERTFPPPCMGFMSLRDEGVPAGCQNDLDATLTMMLVQNLFDKPGFQQNASSDTEKNHYYGAHCTSPTKLNGPAGPAEAYVLRTHAEAGIGTVPEVIWPVGQEVTMAHYLARKKPQMIVYSGKVVGRCEMPPAGGCRTNVALTINEVSDVCDVKGMHQTIFFGNHARQLRRYCQLSGIPVIT